MRYLIVLALLLLPNIAHATFPTVNATSNGSNAASTSHTVNLPTGVSTPGRICVCYFSIRNTFNNTVTWPAGWTQLSGGTIASNSTGNIETRYRVTDGSEGSSITVSSTDSQESSYICDLLSGQHTSTPIEGAAGTVSNTANPDPPSLTPFSLGAGEDILWIAIIGYDAGGSSADPPSSYPTNYTNGTSQCSICNVGVARAYRTLNATTEDPSTFTLGGADDSAPVTIAIRPAASGNRQRIIGIGFRGIIQ